MPARKPLTPRPNPRPHHVLRRRPLTRQELVDYGLPDDFDPTLNGTRCGWPLSSRSKFIDADHPIAFCPNDPARNCRGRCKAHRPELTARPGRGMANHNWSTGSMSRYAIPSHVVERFMAHYSNPEALALTPHLAMTAVRIEQLYEKLSPRDASKRWTDCSNILEDLDSAIDSKDEFRIEKELVRLRKVIVKGGSEFQTWRDIFDAFSVYAKLAETERKRIEAAVQSVRSDHWSWTMAKIGEGVRDIITDSRERSQLISYINQILESPKAGAGETADRLIKQLDAARPPKPEPKLHYRGYQPPQHREALRPMPKHREAIHPPDVYVVDESQVEIVDESIELPDESSSE